MRNCPDCGSNNPTLADRCYRCGHELPAMAKCGNCATDNPLDSAVCSRCGEILASFPIEGVDAWLPETTPRPEGTQGLAEAATEVADEVGPPDKAPSDGPNLDWVEMAGLMQSLADEPPPRFGEENVGQPPEQAFQNTRAPNYLSAPVEELPVSPFTYEEPSDIPPEEDPLFQWRPSSAVADDLPREESDPPVSLEVGSDADHLLSGIVLAECIAGRGLGPQVEIKTRSTLEADPDAATDLLVKVLETPLTPARVDRKRPPWKAPRR